MTKTSPAIIDAIADKHVGQTCTINGHDAKIVMGFDGFALVKADISTGIEVAFAWPTVDRIMSRDGKFRI